MNQIQDQNVPQSQNPIDIVPGLKVFDDSKGEFKDLTQEEVAKRIAEVDAERNTPHKEVYLSEQETNEMILRLQNSAKEADKLIDHTINRNFHKLMVGGKILLIPEGKLPHPLMQCPCGSEESFMQCCMKANYHDPLLPYSQMKPGRNDPCFCNSGKKFKKCCGAT